MVKVYCTKNKEILNEKLYFLYSGRCFSNLQVIPKDDLNPSLYSFDNALVVNNTMGSLTQR